MRVLTLVILLMLPMTARVHAQTVSLAGQWRFQLDREDQGVGGKWFDRVLPDTARLPGTLAEQGIGDAPSLDTKWTGGIQKPNWFQQPELAKYAEPGNFKFPYWLTPEKRCSWSSQTMTKPYIPLILVALHKQSGDFETAKTH